MRQLLDRWRIQRQYVPSQTIEHPGRHDAIDLPTFSLAMQMMDTIKILSLSLLVCKYHWYHETVERVRERSKMKFEFKW